MKNKLKRCLICLLLIGGVVLIGSLSSPKETGLEEKSFVKKNVNSLSMMLETEAGSGNYELTTKSEWPTDGYVFNETLSKCENGGELSWDDENKRILMSGNMSDKCYVYFDIYKPMTLSDYVISQYNGIQGNNNIYYHDSSLTNGAGDNSYRYSGTNPNNFVCFGSIADTCPSNNLYRIIGTFDNQVKLIKYDYALRNLLGTDGDYVSSYAEAGLIQTNKGPNSTSNIGVYYWNYKSTTNGSTNTWSYSLLNKTNLNTNFLNKLGSDWTIKISTVSWKVGGNTSNNITYATLNNVYLSEVKNPLSTNTMDKAIEYSAKIGLMYASDYGYASSLDAWENVLSGFNDSTIASTNWMYMGLYEWILTRNSEYTDEAFSINSDGSIISTTVRNNYSLFSFAVRPCFYLNEDVTYVSGDGTSQNPIRID